RDAPAGCIGWLEGRNRRVHGAAMVFGHRLRAPGSGRPKADPYLPAFSARRLAALGSTASLNLAPATNLGSVVAGILILSPVAGFLPARAARLTALKVPKPTSWTASPFFTAVWIVSIRV